MEQRTLGDYKIIKPIGQGTLGTVYLAEHRFMKRQYVLKVLPEEFPRTGDLSNVLKKKSDSSLH